MSSLQATLYPEKKSTRVDVVFLFPEFTFLHFLLEDMFTHPCVDEEWQEPSRMGRTHQPDVLFKTEKNMTEGEDVWPQLRHIEW